MAAAPASWSSYPAARFGEKCATRRRVDQGQPAQERPPRPVSPHNVTVIGKAFYDIDHARGGKNDRGGKTHVAVWEIHPVMKVLDGDAKLGGGF